MTKIIVVDGPDAVGKETQTKMLVKHLRSQYYTVQHIEVPWRDGLTYPLIYWMLRNGMAKRMPTTFQFVQLCNKILCQNLSIRKDVDYVVLDRWHAASEVYGKATGANKRLLTWGTQFLVKPDVTIILSGPGFPKEGKDTYETDTELQARVRRLYRLYPLLFPEMKAFVIDSDHPRDEVHANIINALVKAQVALICRIRCRDADVESPLEVTKIRCLQQSTSTQIRYGTG